MNGESGRGFFSRLVGMFTKNWGLKLLALALALLIYHTLKPKAAAWPAQEIHDRTLNQF